MADLHTLYSKQELHELCDELEISYDLATNTRVIVQMLINDLDDNGTPADEDCSDLMWNFLIDAGYIDDPDVEEVEEVEEVENDDDIYESEEAYVEPVLTDDLPHCFGFAYPEYDRACRGCSVLEACMERREHVRKHELPCFGIMFDRNDENCKVCMEAGPCRQELIKIGDIKNG